jgi:hypothetical protein
MRDFFRWGIFPETMESFESNLSLHVSWTILYEIFVLCVNGESEKQNDSLQD